MVVVLGLNVVSLTCEQIHDALGFSWYGLNVVEDHHKWSIIGMRFPIEVYIANLVVYISITISCLAHCEFVISFEHS